jgi:hypothetical protein
METTRSSETVDRYDQRSCHPEYRNGDAGQGKADHFTAMLMCRKRNIEHMGNRRYLRNPSTANPAPKSAKQIPATTYKSPSVVLVLLNEGSTAPKPRDSA